MRKIKIFISSVQVEFAEERTVLFDYLQHDPLLGKFFEPFIFEKLPASDQKVDAVYLREVEYSDIYLGLLGVNYGWEDKEGISPTEREFDCASKLNKTRLIFLSSHSTDERNAKQNKFINKVQSILIRKEFSTIHELKASVYASLLHYLEEKEIIRTVPFDASIDSKSTINDLDNEKIADFVRIARSKRGFRLQEGESAEKILTHLNLLDDNRISNAAILLFGKNPQRFFINSEVRCTFFYGNIVEKPIPSYKVFKGDVFELVDQTIEYVLSKLDYAVGTRSESVSIPGKYEIPKEIISEAIVNAIAHRDYTSNGSVQVMIFRNRIEIYNPGILPLGWTTDKLKKIHTSIPANPLLAEPMYLKGYIERVGSGTLDMVRIAQESGIKEPDFEQDDSFKITLYRPSTNQVPTKYQPSTNQVNSVDLNTNTEVINLIKVLVGEMSRKELQDILQLKNAGNFRDNYINQALMGGFISMKNPKNPNSPRQKYSLTEKGLEIKASRCEGVNEGVNEGVKNIEGVNEGVKEELEILYAYIKENPNKKASELSAYMSKSISTIERYLNLLKKNNLVEFVGVPKTGGYRMKEVKSEK